MNIVIMYIAMGLFGVVVGLGGGFFTGGINGMIIGMFAGIIPFMAVIQIIAFAKQKGFLPLYKTLNENEKYAWVPNKMNKLKLFVMKKKYKDILYRKGLGIFENKGTEFNFGNNPMCFIYPWSGYTVNFKTSHYFSLLEKDEGIDDYEDCIKEYLGANKYKAFCEKFRKEPKPDYYSIKNEIQYLIDNKPNNGDDGNPLTKTVFGETIDFTNRLKYLKYNYDPISSENATEREKIIALKEGMDYKEADQAMNRAKAAVMIMIGVAIFIIIISSIDMSQLFGG